MVKISPSLSRHTVKIHISEPLPGRLRYPEIITKEMFSHTRAQSAEPNKPQSLVGKAFLNNITLIFIIPHKLLNPGKSSELRIQQDLKI